MDPGYAFRKTGSGAEEVAGRSSTLSVKQRRCLILIDGKRTLRELAMCFRPGELSSLLRDLVERGYVEEPPGGIAGLESITGGIRLVDQQRFLDIRSRAAREISDRLGPLGDPLALEISRCASPEDLRTVLRHVEQVIRGFLGADQALSFVRRVGRELMGS